jgi:hypothetical protein
MPWMLERSPTGSRLRQPLLAQQPPCQDLAAPSI